MSGIMMMLVGRSPSGEPPPTVIGQAYGGGYYAGQISTAGNGVADYYLVVAPLSSGQATGIKWKSSNTATSGADSVINGPQNTADIVADGDSTTYPAAHFCNDLVIGGYSDWYMPAQNELEVCYYNLKPTTTNNNDNYGTNNNSVPKRTTNYTAGTPAQTSAADFKDTGTEDFLADSYWTSTESGSASAWTKDFSNGLDSGDTKNGNLRVRAIRRVPV